MTAQFCTAQQCSREALQSDAAKVKVMQADLLAIKVDGQGMEDGVSPETQKLIRSFKDALATTVDDSLRCQSVGSVDPKKLEGSFAALIAANKKPVGSQDLDEDTPENVDGVYGRDLEVTVKRSERWPELLTIAIDFGIPCGDDSMLLVYEVSGNVWHKAVQWQSGDYKDISGAFGDFFEYEIVPRGPAGEGWGVAVAHGHPWCTSNWSAYDIDVIAPTINIERVHFSWPQRVFYHRHGGYRRSFEPNAVMKPEPDGFELRLAVNSLDLSDSPRDGIFRYRIEGEHIVRVQPIALNGRDFVDEWLQAEWKDAARWSSPGRLTALKNAHTKIEKRQNSDTDGSATLEYGPIQTCTDDKHHFQVEATVGDSESLYFQILQRKSVFTMLAISHQPAPRCKVRNPAHKGQPDADSSCLKQ